MVTDNDTRIHPCIRKSEKHVTYAGSYTLEQAFDLVNDPELLKAGVEICARMKVNEFGFDGRIVFRRSWVVSTISCTHAVVDQIIFDAGEEKGFRSVSTEGRPALRNQLTPEEHYVALKSYVGYLAEEGILNLLMASFKAELDQEKQEFGANHLMCQQHTRALLDIAPETTANLLELMFINGYSNNVRQTHQFCDAFFSMLETSEISLIVKIMKALKLPESIRQAFSHHLDRKTREEIAQRAYLPTILIRRLAKDRHRRVRMKIAERTELPTRVISKLARDVSYLVRMKIAERADLPDKILHRLVKDRDPSVRQKMAQNATITIKP